MTEQPFQKTVLIIDDIPASLGILVEALMAANFEILVAESGQQALQLLQHAIHQQLLPDIILLDVSMPGLDGFETCRQIKATPALTHIPVLFVTSHNEAVEKVRGFDVGGADYITKPVDLVEVQARINTHLAISRLQRQLQTQNDSLAQERNKLLEVMDAQSDQLREITANALSFQDQQRQSILRLLGKQVQEKFSGLTFHLNAALADLPADLKEHQASDSASAGSSTADSSIAEHLQSSITLLNEASEQVTQMIVDLTKQRAEIEQDNPLLLLSNREREVLNLIADGKENSKIAAILHVEPSTIRTYRARIMNKLGASNAYDLMRIALAYIGP